MRAADFISAPEELLPAAIRYGASLRDLGYSVKIEPFSIAYPRTPFFLARRQHTALIVEVQSSPRLNIVREWVRYGKGCRSDTRVMLGLAEGATLRPPDLDSLQRMGAGVYMIGSGGPYEVLPPLDLALNLDLPKLPAGLKRLLGGAYSQFHRGQWREGFEDACQVLEQEARRYLKLHLGRGRIAIVSGNGKPRTAPQIERMPLGSLANAFGEIQVPNSADTRIGQAIARVNPDRVSVAHYKGKSAAREEKLRTNVAHNMFVIVGALRRIKGIPN